MTGNHLFWFQLLFVVKVKADTFLHEPSCIEIEPPELATDFGSTLAYHPNMQSLVVGAPFSDKNGKVFLCAINEDALKNKTIMCNQIPIDITEKVLNYSRSKSPDQHFGLGASISVTPERIFTCAPLVTLDIPTSKGSEYGACGTCFISDGASTNRSIGMVEQYYEQMNTNHTSDIEIDDFYGGVGWSTLPDVDNQLILIAKPMPFSSLHFIDMAQPSHVKMVDEVTAKYNYIGGAMVFGTFFKGYAKLYAFSADTNLRLGFIAFLSYNDREKKMELLKFGNRRPKIVMIKDNNAGSMFGSTLHSANLDPDNYTDLLVGAPAQVNVEGGYENGAVHIYMGGVSIAFLSYNDREKKMELLKFGNRRPKIVMIKDNNAGSMFGSTLHSANLDPDNYTDLLVGAPAQVNVEGGYENGAVHIYMGGVSLDEDFSKFKICIHSNKDASRFGSSIATSDLDGDGYSEIFVSAPYEDKNKGAVYILSGSEVNQLFIDKKTSVSKSFPVTDLVHTQKIQNPGLQTLGFSLQVLPVPSFDENGESLLAMGSLMSGKVALYRSLPLIKVNINARLKGVNRVRVIDENFTMSVTVEITYPSNLTLITGKLLVTTTIEGDAAWIETDGVYEIMLSERKTLHFTDVVVSLGNYKRGLYIFNATVQPDIDNLKREDFDSSLVGISPNSNTTVVLNLRRECQDEDCVPNLSLTFEWSGSNKTHYALGSTASETISLVVRNDGGATSGSCARINITGAKVALLDCNMDESWYKCNLTDIERYTTRNLPISLDMSKPTNKHTGIVIEVMLYNNCTSAPNRENYTATIAYEFNTDDIYFNSTNFNRIITDSEIENVETGPYIDINELYTVTNKGNMSWSSLPLEIYLQEEPFIKDYLVQVEAGDCSKDDAQLKYNCTVVLKPDSTVKIQGTVTLVKDKIVKSLVKGKLKVVSHFKMDMVPTSKIFENLYFTEIGYQKTIGLKNNMYIVIAIAILLGVFVMAVIVIALYKGGFFKRKEKQELVDLKHEIRKQSIRRPAPEDLPQCVMNALKSEQQDQEGGSTGTNSSETLGVDDVSQHKEVPETQREAGDNVSIESNYSK